MNNYEVTIRFSEIFEVEANSEQEAQDKAHAMFVNSFNCVPVPDEYEVECLGENEDWLESAYENLNIEDKIEMELLKKTGGRITLPP